MRDEIVFYASWLEAIKNLPREIQGEVFTAIIEYGLYGKTTETPKPITGAMLAMVKPQLDAKSMRYKNGKKGGRPSNKIESTDTQDDKIDVITAIETKSKPNENLIETKSKPNENLIEIENEKESNKEKDKEKENTPKGVQKKETEKPIIAAKAATLSRKDRFYESLVPYLEKYPKEMIRDFFDYWSEMNKSCSKMRFEQQTTWELHLRLATWAKKDRTYGNSRKSDKAEANSYAMQKLAERIEQREQSVPGEIQDPW